MLRGWKSFGADDHSMAPCDRFSDWYGFKYTQSHVSVWAGLTSSCQWMGNGMGE